MEICCIDYILATRGCLPSIKHINIQPSIKGSDQHPIYVDLQDEITNDDGRKLHWQHDLHEC
ncbi:hypothetical protein EDD17DRAFT_1480556 [Pisolithus thermaeus]|nr:hypothetical protein EV401DRAFT_1856161 [Pisolithus croceorrhizus]KAI6161682.1 hypothetical protein EDD17DRAFT_1480556 [Pisolithus thermaeus]